MFYHVNLACYQYSRKRSNYLERIVLSDPTLVVSMADLVAISVEKPKIDSGCSLE